MQVLAQLSALFGAVASLLSLRTFPLFAFALLSPRFGASTKLFALGTYASIAGLAWTTDRAFIASTAGYAAGLAYFALCALLLVWLSHRGLARRLPRLLLVALLTSAFVVAPGLLGDRPGAFAVLMTGWELFFSGYSYAVESARHKPGRSLADGMFFLLVNPALSYPERGGWLREPASDARVLRRCGIGVALLFAQALSAPLVPLVTELALAVDLSWAARYGTFVVASAAGLARAFLAQSGVAHVHIGLLALMGFGAPERFDAPWRSATPADFWRRWNMYLGQWFRRYVFNPVSYRIARHRRVPAPARSVAALLITFALAGAAHDAVWLVQDGRAGNGLLAFGAAALAVLLYEARPVQAAARGAHGSLARWASRALSWHLVFATVWLFGFLVPR